MKKRVKKRYYIKAKKRKIFKKGKEWKLLQRSKISLILNTYEDIFSGFDPRPYHEKALSDDFLQEAKRASIDKEDVGLEFLVPKKLRNFNSEEQIKKRLKEHFRKHHNSINLEVSKIKRKGWYFAFGGLGMIILAAFLSSLGSSNLIIHFFTVLFEAGGWFTGWTGLDQIYYTAGNKKPDLEFYKKMSKCKIIFLSY